MRQGGESSGGGAGTAPRPACGLRQEGDRAETQERGASSGSEAGGPGPGPAELLGHPQPPPPTPGPDRPAAPRGLLSLARAGSGPQGEPWPHSTMEQPKQKTQQLNFSKGRYFKT